MSQQVLCSAQKAQLGRHGRTWVEYAARVGYATKGVIYWIIGGLAAAAGWGAGGETTGSEGAISEIRQQPFGHFLLWIVTIGPAAIKFMTVLFPMVQKMR